VNELWIATSNEGKLNEFKMLFNRLPYSVHAQKELPVFAPRPETGDTFEANARIKAKTLYAVTKGKWTLGDDSGLMVNGLGGLPGVHSARYAGPKASDSENVAKLLKMLTIRHIADRTASFISCIVLISPTGEEYVFEGKLAGKISTVAKGKTGFGYDCVFIPDGETLTLGELGLAQKNKISHRARACEQVAEKLSASGTV
jgi:XTP/dITP diphosphohydrolase